MSRPEARAALLLIGALTLWRLAALRFDATDLWVDEAQYWLWGQRLDWGYFSKPPLIAWLLRAVTDIAGSDAVFWIRAPGAVLHAATAVLVGLAAARLGDAATGWGAAALYATLPFVTLGSWQMSTDTVMLPFYALGILAWLRLTEGRSAAWAITLGAAAGLAFLAKYAAIYLPATLTLAALLLPRARIAPRDALAASLVALAVAAPNLAWNALNGGQTFQHIAEDNVRIGAAAPSLARAGRFLASQIAVFGPTPALLLAGALWQAIRRRAAPGTALMLVLSLPVLAVVAIQAWRAQAHANWAVAAYLGGSILAASLLAGRPRLRRLNLGLHGTLAFAFPLAFIFAQSIPGPNGQLLAQRYLGPKELSEAIAATARREGLGTIVADSRGVLADLFHRYANGEFALFAPRPAGRPANYYEATFPLPDTASGPLLYVTQGAVPPCPVAREVSRITPGANHYRGDLFTLWRLDADCLVPGD